MLLPRVFDGLLRQTILLSDSKVREHILGRAIVCVFHDVKLLLRFLEWVERGRWKV